MSETAPETSAPEAPATPETPAETSFKTTSKPETPAAPEAPAERPAWLPEKFQTAEDLAKSYAALEGKLGQKAEAMRAELLAELRQGVPAEAKGYEFKLPDDALPPGFRASPPAEDDPFFSGMRELFHELGAKPEQWQKALTGFVQWQASAFPNAEAERGRLGEGADERVAALDMKLAKLFEGDMPAYQALTRWATADLVRGLERLVGAAQGPDILNGLPTAGSLPITPEEAAGFMAHADYRDPHKGAEMREKVRGFIQAGGRVPGFAPPTR